MNQVIERSILVASMIFLVGCGSGKQTYEISDVTKESTITLRKNANQKNIHSITIMGKGYLDGDAEIVLILDNKPYKTERISGNVNFERGGDWYSDGAEIRYKPSSVKGGKLTLYYEFYD
ncbi:MAG: hypothetical protein AAF378_04885 [Cyanobacteria bacterium P01_A01_bin.84]